MTTTPPGGGRPRMNFPGGPQPGQAPGNRGTQPPPGNGGGTTPPPAAPAQGQAPQPPQNGAAAPTGRLGRIEQQLKNQSGVPLLFYSYGIWFVAACFGFCCLPVTLILSVLSAVMAVMAGMRAWKRYQAKEISGGDFAVRVSFAVGAIGLNLVVMVAAAWWTIWITSGGLSTA